MPWVSCHPVEVAKLVYVEVPKAGCSSLKWALSGLKGGPPPDGTPIHEWFGYTTAPSVERMHEWLQSRWASFFRFTVVRDPVSRFESFFYDKLTPLQRYPWGDINRYLLEAFARDPWNQDIHVYPQTLILGRELDRFDYVGHLEDMDGVARTLSDEIGVPIEMPHLNRSLGERRPLSRSSIALLHEIYREDFEVLGYD